MKEEFTTVSKNADGSTTECTATFENGQVEFEQTSTPAPGAVPVPTQEDAGKAVIVDENGQYGLGSISGGTKLYHHNIVIKDSVGGIHGIQCIATSSTEATISSGSFTLDGTVINMSKFIFNNTWSNHYEVYQLENGAFSIISIGTIESDTVTEL